jgi:methylglyoxal synthase
MNTENISNMKKQLTIALVAHDRRKADMVEWAVHNATMLAKHRIICTGTTGRLIQEAFQQIGIEADITRMNSGPMGGDAEIAALVVRKLINLAWFPYRRPDAQPHEAIIKCCPSVGPFTMCP